MARLCLTAEGKTEQQFATQVLVPHLAGFGVYLARPRLAATSRGKGQVQRGGLLSYEVVKNDIQRWLKQEHADDVYFTTMFDLYGLPHGFPGFREATSIPDKYLRVQSLERALHEDIFGRLRSEYGRFIPYIQLHEFEAILFSNPKAFCCYYEACERQAKGLMSVLEEFSNPELINDGNQTAPSKRIIEQFPDYEGYKPTAGPLIAENIGLKVIRTRCRHFDEWLTKLERLGGKPGGDASVECQ
jgi:hypothetical protein